MSGTHIKGLIRKPSELCLDSLHAAVYELQALHGLDDSEFAKALGIGRTHYCEFKYGKRELGLASIKVLYKLNVPAHVLLQ